MTCSSQQSFVAKVVFPDPPKPVSIMMDTPSLRSSTFNSLKGTSNPTVNSGPSGTPKGRLICCAVSSMNNQLFESFLCSIKQGSSCEKHRNSTLMHEPEHLKLKV